MSSSFVIIRVEKVSQRLNKFYPVSKRIAKFKPIIPRDGDGGADLESGGCQFGAPRGNIVHFIGAVGFGGSAVNAIFCADMDLHII